MRKEYKGMKVKKFLSTLLVMAMVVSLLPGIALTAEAGKSGGNYTITNNLSSGFDVSGKGTGYPTLATALADCNPLGGEGVPNVQFGSDADHPLTVTEVSEEQMAHNVLRSARYRGNVEITRDSSLENGNRSYGLCIPSCVNAEFNDLTVAGDAILDKAWLGAVYVSGGTLTVNSGASITVNQRYDSAIYADSGSIAIEGGTLKAAADDSIEPVLNCAGSASAVISGGTLETCGKNGTAIGQLSTGTVTVTGGTIKASSSSGKSNSGITIGPDAGTVTVSGGTVSATGTESVSAGIIMADAHDSVLEISGNASINGRFCSVANMADPGKDISGGTVNITGGTLSATGSEAYAIINSRGTFNISGGTISSLGTAKFSTAFLSMNESSAYPGALNVSGSAELSSASQATIFLFGMGAIDSDSASINLFGKTIYNSNKANIAIKGGKIDSSYVLKSTNYTSAEVTATVMADVFAGWSNDKARSSIISTTNPATLSSLTTGANSIYLKTIVPPDYIITGGPTSFKIKGSKETYDTLAKVLAVCTDKGSDGVLTIQLGDGTAPLEVAGINESSSEHAANDLIAATYTGSLKLTFSSSSSGLERGRGIEVEAGTVKFKDLTLTTDVSGKLVFFWPILVHGGALNIEDGTAITAGANTSYAVFIDSGSLNMSGGSISSAGGGVSSTQQNTSGTISISGGTITAGGNGMEAVASQYAAIQMTGGTLRATHSTQGYGIKATDACVSVSGGSVSCAGTSSLSAAIYSQIGGLSRPSIVTVSGTAEVVSTASANTILLGLNGGGTENAVVFGKSIHSSDAFYISVMGAASSSSFKVASSNVSDAALIAFYPYSTTKSFAAWTSDAAFANSISAINGDTISKLTTGDNSAVTNIYLKTGTDTSIVLAAGSLGKAGKQSVTDLTAGKKYKVTMGAVTYYAKADGTLSPLVFDAAALTGTELKGLTNGAVYKVEAIASGDGGNGGSYTPPVSNTATVIVGGSTQPAGTLETTTQSGRTATTVTISTDKLKNILDNSASGATLTVPITTGADTASGRLDGQAVKAMEAKDAVLEIKTESASYTLPASEIKIDSVSEKLGEKVSLGDITVNVTISKPSNTTAKVVESAAQNGGYSLVAPAVEFKVSCTYGGRTVEVSTFNSYVERLIAIPNGVDPSKITTGIVVDPDGTTHHVPTEIIIVDGKYYAKINSLTNSIYSVIYNPVKFSDLENHWAKMSVNNMGSRLVVNGVGNNKYEPDRSITRAEFAAVMVKALGLEPGKGTNGFDDVNASAWYCGYVATASSYGVIKGYNSKAFGPSDSITREQAMTMIARAMKITGLKLSLTESQISELLAGYADGANASSYAKESIAACLKAGIISGTSEKTLSPKDSVTRAEVAVMAERLLEKSKLI